MADYAALLRDHVTLRCRSLDRIILQAYVPKLQSVGDLCKFLRWQRKFKIHSSAAFGKIGDQYVKAVHRFAEQHKIPVAQFKKGQDKEKLARPSLEAAARTGQDCVVLIGIAQEKASRLAVLAAESAAEGISSAHGLGPTDGLHPSLLFLSLGCGMGWNVLEDQRLCSLSHLALAQRA